MIASTARIGDLAEQVRGVTYRSEDASPRPLPGYRPILRAGNITDQGLTFDDLVYVPAERISDKQKLRRNDIVIAASSGSLDVVGKAAAAREDYDGAVGAFCKILRPRGDVEPAYFAQFFRTHDYRRRISALAAGANINNLRNEHLDNMAIPLPPLSEQRRIAAILDQADALRTKRRAAIAQLDTLAQSIFLDMFGDPAATNQSRWDTTPLGEVATFVGGGTPSRACQAYFSGSICWATSKDMTSEFLDTTQEHITEEAIANSATKLVPAGTILVVVKSKILAHRLPVAVTRVPTCFGQDLKGIQPDESFEVSFVAASLRLGQSWLLRRARGINTEGLTLEHLRAFPLLTVPLALQHEFSRRLSSVHDLKRVQRVGSAHLDALFASLQHRAFQGEL